MINQSQRLRQLREKQNRPGSNSTTTTENQARRRILDSLPPHSPGSGHQTRVRHVLLSLPKLKPNPPTGDQSRMYSALSTVFQGPISGEEKKTHRSPTSLYALLFPTEYPVTPPLVARAVDKDSSSYLLSLQQMPSYTADIFDKADGWVATPQPVSQSILLLTYERQRSQVYAVDCELVRRHFYFSTPSPTQPGTVSDRIRQGTDTGLHHQQRVRHRSVRQALRSTQTHHRLPHRVMFSLLSRRTLTIHHLDGQASPKHPSPRSKPNSPPSSHSKAVPLPSSSVNSSNRTLKPSGSTRTPLHSSTSTRSRPLKPRLAWLAKKWC
jgi:hypothetical protein